MKKRLWAIGFKQHVELRQAYKKPIEQVTETMVKSDYFKEKFKLRTVAHIGGTVIKTMGTNKFLAITGMYVGEGQMVEVPSRFGPRF